MDIEIGEWIRTKNKGICKVHYINKNAPINRYWVNPCDDWCSVVKTTEILKHSQNLIDLIEVGDIVHTKDVLHEDIACIWSKEYLNTIIQDIKNGIELVEILTHEQYKQNCYKVGKENETFIYVKNVKPEEIKIITKED